MNNLAIDFHCLDCISDVVITGGYSHEIICEIHAKGSAFYDIDFYTPDYDVFIHNITLSVLNPDPFSYAIVYKREVDAVLGDAGLQDLRSNEDLIANLFSSSAIEEGTTAYLSEIIDDDDLIDFGTDVIKAVRLHAKERRLQLRAFGLN